MGLRYHLSKLQRPVCPPRHISKISISGQPLPPKRAYIILERAQSIILLKAEYSAWSRHKLITKKGFYTTQHISVSNARGGISLGTRFPSSRCPGGSRKKVRAEKSSNRQKSQTFIPLELFYSKFFWFIWMQRCYNNGRPLILKLVPNDEE